MQNIISIPTYQKIDNKFVIVNHTNYTINYIKGIRNHCIRILVNGILSHQNINLLHPKKSYKEFLLKAISEYKNNQMYTGIQPNPKNYLTIEKLQNNNLSFVYKVYKKHINDYLLPIKKEDKRDTLTKFNLI